MAATSTLATSMRRTIVVILMALTANYKTSDFTLSADGGV
jgi:hypothetical protein